MTADVLAWYKAGSPHPARPVGGLTVACGCGGKAWKGETVEAKEPPVLKGTSNPAYTWPPRGNGPAPKA